MLSWAVYVSDYSRYCQERQRVEELLGRVRRQCADACLYAGLGIYITAVAPRALSVASIGIIAGKWILPILAISCWAATR